MVPKPQVKPLARCGSERLRQFVAREIAHCDHLTPVRPWLPQGNSGKQAGPVWRARKSLLENLDQFQFSDLQRQFLPDFPAHSRRRIFASGMTATRQRPVFRAIAMAHQHQSAFLVAQYDTNPEYRPLQDSSKMVPRAEGDPVKRAMHGSGQETQHYTQPSASIAR